MYSEYNHKKAYIIGAVALAVILLLWFVVPRTHSCNVAYIPLHGDLVTYVPASEATSTGNAYDQTSSEDVTAAIRQAAADPSIKAIVLEIDSPGGSPVGGQEIELALKQIHKPTVALIRGEGDSAAYLAATGADTIFASVFSGVGDIGITESYVDNAQQDITNGLTFNQLSIGKYKDMFDTDKPLTADEQALAMKELQINYQDFVQIVAQNRHMSIGTATTLANGAEVTGEEALQDGLIDKLGNIDDVRNYLSGELKQNAVICGVDINP
ncbi:MAG: S49 family peptidase [Minisyncoccia bacterium]|jgi:protease-4